MALIASGLEDQGRQLAKAEDMAYANVKRSLATIILAGQDRASIVCVDGSKGLFLAHRSAVPFPKVMARMSSGAIIQLNLRALDETTQTCLLQAPNPIPDLSTLKLSNEPKSPFGRLFAVLPSGPIPVELVSTARIGVIDEGKRVLPLLEVRFEASLERVGGAPIFTSHGELVGVINATLAPQNDVRDTPAARGSGFGSLNESLPKAAANLGLTSNQYGPQSLTVGYALGPLVLHKVIKGLSSDAREVQLPTLGVFIGEFGNRGVEVKTVQIGSAAEVAGLKSGDVIIEINGMLVKNQVDYVRNLMSTEIGSGVPIKVQRGLSVVSLTVTPRE